MVFGARGGTACQPSALAEKTSGEWQVVSILRPTITIISTTRSDGVETASFTKDVISMVKQCPRTFGYHGAWREEEGGISA